DYYCQSYDSSLRTYIF
nr:immunoglobulin light chain junction region [Macaca mulatta]MOW59563.1 immunoglobulin light chain junction region [Macaca mulatta]